MEAVKRCEGKGCGNWIMRVWDKCPVCLTINPQTEKGDSDAESNQREDIMVGVMKARKGHG